MWYGVVTCISRIYDSRAKPRGTNVTKNYFAGNNKKINFRKLKLR